MRKEKVTPFTMPSGRRSAAAARRRPRSDCRASWNRGRPGLSGSSLGRFGAGRSPRPRRELPRSTGQSGRVTHHPLAIPIQLVAAGRQLQHQPPNSPGLRQLPNVHRVDRGVRSPPPTSRETRWRAERSSRDRQTTGSGGSSQQPQHHAWEDSVGAVLLAVILTCRIPRTISFWRTARIGSVVNPFGCSRGTCAS